MGLEPTGPAGRTPETRGGSEKYQELGAHVKMIFIGRDLLHVIASKSIAKNSSNAHCGPDNRARCFENVLQMGKVRPMEIYLLKSHTWYMGKTRVQIGVCLTTESLLVINLQCPELPCRRRWTSF